MSKDNINTIDLVKGVDTSSLPTIKGDEVRQASEILALFLLKGEGDELIVELKNFKRKGDSTKLGDFKITVEKE